MAPAIAAFFKKNDDLYKNLFKGLLYVVTFYKCVELFLKKKYPPMLASFVG